MTPPLKTPEKGRATSGRAALFAFLLIVLALAGLPSAASAKGPTFSLTPIDAPGGRGCCPSAQNSSPIGGGKHRFDALVGAFWAVFSLLAFCG